MAGTKSFADQQAGFDHRSLVRKCLRAIALIGPPTVDLPEALTDETGAFLDLSMSGLLPVGIVSTDGYVYSSDVEKDDIDALGYADYVRSDLTRVAKQIAFTPLEYGKRHMLELTKGMDLSAVTQAASGEITFDEPELPTGAEYRLLVIANDGPVDNEWLLGRGYPRVKLAETDDESWASEGAISQQITLDVFTDEELGTSCRNYIAGTGAKAASEALGFTQAVAG